MNKKSTEWAQLACSALLKGVDFETVAPDGSLIKVRECKMYNDGDMVARIRNGGLYVTVIGSRNETTFALLNHLPNTRIEGDYGVTLNGREWSGCWSCVVDDLFKHDNDL